MGFINYLRKHIVSSFAILVGIAVIIVGASSFASSKNDYDNYLEQYNKQQEKLQESVPKLPKSVFMDNDYVTYSGGEIESSKSAYSKFYVYTARTATVAPLTDSVAQEYKKVDPTVDDDPFNEYISGLDRFGGAITFSIVAEENGYADIAIDMKSNWLNAQKELIGYENITDQIKIQFNKLEVKTTECELPVPEGDDDFSTLVLKEVYLLKGRNILTFTSSAYNPYKSDSNKVLYVVPDIRNVSVMSSVTITMPEE